jgi:hypothetical protein
MKLQRVTFLLERSSFCRGCLVTPCASVQYGWNMLEMRGGGEDHGRVDRASRQ